MYFRTTVWQCLKGNQSKITNHYQYIIYAGSKSWETSLTSHLNFQPQISSMEKHHYKYLAAGKTVQWNDCVVSTRRVWLLPVQHFLPVQKESKRLLFALAAFYTPFLLVQSSAQAPDRRGLISGLHIPIQSLTSGTRTFASQLRVLLTGPCCTQHRGSGMPQI